MARILLLLTRAPQDAGGRGVVLRTIIDSLVAEGHAVHAMVSSPPENDAIDGTASWVPLPGPSRRDIITGRAARARGLRSLNERLYYSPDVAAAVRQRATDVAADLVISDGVRLAALAEDTGLPWFVDLDDLLSDRYASWAEHGMRLDSLLGHRRPEGDMLSRVLSVIPAKPVLRRESTVLESREIEIARSADGVSLVSPNEAGRLQRRSGRPVRDLPMALEVTENRLTRPVGALDRRVVFPGSLSAFANEQAVQWWIEELEPALRAAGLPGWTMHHFGAVPSGLAAKVDSEAVVLRGSMPMADLHKALVGHDILLAPQREELGLTVKVVEAAALGLIPITTPQGAAALRFTDGADIRLFDSPDALVAVIRDLEAASADERRALAARAQQTARTTFSKESLQARWREVVESLTAAGVTADVS